MKRFLPSSVMLIPFVVRHYDEDEEEHGEMAESTQTNHASSASECKPTPAELE